MRLVKRANYYCCKTNVELFTIETNNILFQFSILFPCKYLVMISLVETSIEFADLFSDLIPTVKIHFLN